MGEGQFGRGERTFLGIYSKLSDTQFGIGGTSLVTAQRQLRVHTTPPAPFLSPQGRYFTVSRVVC